MASAWEVSAGGLMTTQIFPAHYLAILAARAPGTDILLGRNLLLIVPCRISEGAGEAVSERGSPS